MKKNNSQLARRNTLEKTKSKSSTCKIEAHLDSSSPDFLLSDKITNEFAGSNKIIEVKDVKQFIKLLRKEICCCKLIRTKYNPNKLCNNCYAINYLAGDKLQ